MSDFKMSRDDAKELFTKVKTQLFNQNQFRTYPRNLVYWTYHWRDRLKEHGHTDLAERLTDSIRKYKSEMHRTNMWAIGELNQGSTGPPREAGI